VGRLFSSSSNTKFLRDEEFGDIEIRRVKGAFVRLKIQPSGKLVAQLPRYASLYEIVKLLENSRESLRENLSDMPAKKTYADGDQVGKSHRLVVREGVRESATLNGLDIIITTKPTTSPVQKDQLIKDGVAKALRQEAKAYLTRRLKYLALTHGFTYERIRFTHAKSRWGSCSTSGTISLNIMLMTVPNDLIDYVLLHELNHTRHMNHSTAFWADLGQICPNAKRKRTWLKQFSPYL
jgi:predicted metal-dependent hydrolase